MPVMGVLLGLYYLEVIWSSAHSLARYQMLSCSQWADNCLGVWVSVWMAEWEAYYKGLCPLRWNALSTCLSVERALFSLTKYHWCSANELFHSLPTTLKINTEYWGKCKSHRSQIIPKFIWKHGSVFITVQRHSFSSLTNTQMFIMEVNSLQGCVTPYNGLSFHPVTPGC